MVLVIEVSLLGPPRVERDGTLIAFDTRKAMALLALLAVSERSRTRDTLADLLWPGNDPDHARAALRRTLSDLRHGLGGTFLEATHDHVRLTKGPDMSVDVDRFRSFCERGDLQDAVDLYRGEFLEGLAVRRAPDFEEWVEVQGDALRRELTAVLASLTEKHEAAGDLSSALKAALRWLDLDPLHEPAHRALMRLYAATGDRAAALTQYRECARTLSRELGVPPLTETTELYQAINRGVYVAPVRARPAVVAGADAVVTSPPFVGRADDLAAARAAHDAVDNDGRVVLVEGEAGIGKTRLAEELLGLVRRRGGRVLLGHAYEDEVGLAYAPVVEAVRARLREDDDWLADVHETARREAARLVPEIVRGRSFDSASSLSGPAAETRFLAGVWETLVAATGGGDAPGALFIDDVQWADDATLGLLGYGLRRLPGRPLLVVLAWRTPQEHPLRRAVAAVARAGGGVVLELERLGEEAVGDLVRAARKDGDDQATARHLWQKSEGVPLVVVEYLRTPDLDASTPLPSGVRDLLRARLDPVSETGRQVLAAAAVVGRSFDVDVVRAVSGRTEEETVNAVEEVLRRGLVVEGGAEYDFVHDLLRELVYDETSVARRRLLHGRAARVPGTPAATVARHLQLSGRDAQAAVAFRRAGELARQVFANAEALEHFEAALELGHPDRTGLRTAIADLQTLMGDYTSALLTLEAAATDCPPDQVAAVQQRLGRLQQRRGEYALAEVHLKSALAATADEDPVLRAGIMAELSLAAEFRGDPPRAEQLAHRSRALAQEAGDARALCQAHNLLGVLATEHGDTEEALESLQRCRELAELLDEPDLRAAALNNLALARAARGEREEAIELTRTALDLCVAMGDRHREAALHNNLADLLHATGDTEDAMAHLKAAVEIFAEVGAEEEPQAGIWKLVRW